MMLAIENILACRGECMNLAEILYCRIDEFVAIAYRLKST
jgi:hypothetical protein